MFLLKARFMHPLMYGDYPEIMKTNVGTRLPAFTKDQLELVKGSFDFVGINYYTVVMAKDTSVSLMAERKDFVGDPAAEWICMSCISYMIPFLLLNSSD